MSFIYERASEPLAPGPSYFAAGGEATLGEIWSAARDNMIYADNFNGREAAIEEAYDRRIDAIQRATGIPLQNPQRAVPSSGRDITRMPDFLAEQRAAFDRRLAELALQHPAHAGAIRADISPETDARDIARAAGEQLDRLTASRPGFSRWLPMLGGSFAGSLRDPLQVALLFAGGGPGAARTIGGRILSVMAKEAAINGLGEAAMQPKIQAWRKEAGLPAGFEQGAENVALAATLGGLFGGVLQGGYEGARLFRGASLDQAARQVAAPLPDESPLKAALQPEAPVAGREAALMEALDPIRQALPAEGRGAAAAIETDAAVRANARGMDGQAFDSAFSATAALAEEIGQPRPRPELMATLKARMLREFSRGAPEKTPAPPSLFAFLASKGGIRDTASELAGRNLESVMVPRHGRLVRKDGLSLDEAREAAAQAGYMDEFGGLERAVVETDVNDFLRLIDREQAGEPVTSSFDADRVAAIAARESYEDARQQLEDAIGDIGEALTDDVPDAIKERAVTIRLEERVEPVEALERAFLEAGEDAADEGEIADAPFFDLDPSGRAEAFEAKTDGPLQLQALERARGGDEEDAGMIVDVVMEDGEVRVIERRLDDALEEADRGAKLAFIVEHCMVTP
ncbi:MAG: hypothetical protein AB7S41_11390 [Parvibaculaceae bacterium]